MKPKIVTPKSALKFPITDRLGNKIIGISPSTKIDLYLGTMGSDTFFKVILKQKEYNCLVTDDSSLTDFGEEADIYIKRIKRLYKVDVSDIKRLYLWKIFKRLNDNAKRHRLQRV